MDEEEKINDDILGGVFGEDDTGFPLEDDIDMVPMKFDESEDDPDDKFH
ncbi:MAG: hypothetical protein M3P22_00875 [bacterium]|nr:hypothetical protein [bacterium]